MVANIIYSDRLNATWVKCHLVAFNPGGNYQGNYLNSSNALTGNPSKLKFKIIFQKLVHCTA